MGLVDSIVDAGKFLIGTGIGMVLLLIGLLSAGFLDGALSVILALVFIVVGAGFILWGEQSRRNALGGRSRR